VRADTAAPERPAAERSTPALTGTRVLVVDDQPDARALMQAVLGAAGASVEAAASADEARRAIAARRPDIVVSDIGMPGEDGYALIRSIRQQDERTGAERLPCVAVTAYARDDDRMRALAAGYDRHVTKPVDPAVLLHAIADLTV
jgi:CheY-like chemotaxis protein